MSKKSFILFYKPFKFDQFCRLATSAAPILFVGSRPMEGKGFISNQAITSEL